MKNNITDIEEFENALIEAGRTQVLVMHKNVILFFIILSAVITFLALPRSFWLIPTKTTDKAINPHKNPIMKINDENVTASDFIPFYYSDKLIRKESFDKKTTYYIIPLAKYSLSGRVIAKNKFFFDKNDFDKVALIDLGVVWGDLADDNYFNKLSSNSRKYLNNARGLMVFFSEKYRPEYGHLQPYVNNHFSHTHVIPANKNIMRALNYANIGENIKIDGYLVDLYTSKKIRFAKTSLSNSDTNESSRGGGACEVMYVMRVQIGKKIFE